MIRMQKCLTTASGNKSIHSGLARTRSNLSCILASPFLLLHQVNAGPSQINQTAASYHLIESAASLFLTPKLLRTIRKIIEISSNQPRQVHRLRKVLEVQPELSTNFSNWTGIYDGEKKSLLILSLHHRMYCLW